MIQVFRHIPQPCPPPEKPNFLIHTCTSSMAHGESSNLLSIKCALGGTETFEVGLCQYAVDDHSYLILNEGQAYSAYIDSEDDVEMLSIFFAPPFVRDGLRSYASSDEGLLDDPFEIAAGPVDFVEKLYGHDGVVSPLVAKVRNAVRSGLDDSVWLEGCYQLLLGRLLEVHKGVREEASRLPAVRKATRMELYRRLHQARDFLDASLASTIQIGDAAKVACMSEHHFLRRFREAFGETPHKYLTRKRLEAASRLLRETNLPVTEVCFAVGFQSPGSFTSLFSRTYGSSPKVFRMKGVTEGSNSQFSRRKE